MQGQKRREFVKKSAKIVGLAMFANPLIVACDSSTKAKNQNSTKEQTMQNTLKLIYPQWQGGVIAQWFKDLSPENAAKGYVWGCKFWICSFQI